MVAPHTPGSDTSKEAAEAIADVTGALRRRVYEHIISRGSEGTTDDAAEETLEMKHTTYTARRGELVKQGLVANSGKKGLTRSGRRAVLWVAINSDNAVELAEKAKANRKKPVKAPKIPLVPEGVDITLRAVQERMVERLQSGDEIKCPCCGTRLQQAP